jgi:hypothetical protein
VAPTEQRLRDLVIPSLEPDNFPIEFPFDAHIEDPPLPSDLPNIVQQKRPGVDAEPSLFFYGAAGATFCQKYHQALFLHGLYGPASRDDFPWATL